MAGNNVIRRDVIEVTWDVDSSPLDRLTRQTQRFGNDFDRVTRRGERDMRRVTDQTRRTRDALRDNVREGRHFSNALRATVRKEYFTQLNKQVDEFGKKLGGGIVKAAGAATKAMTAFGAAASAALLGAGVASIKAYANYEQLVGGVETLFKGDAGIVIKNADRAFSTAGMSANDYMETVTGFSASLLQGLKGDTKKAASYSDRALTDMSDNANKMGTDIESIKYAYQGFAKQNYTMLDNLKLGYGGTQEEMKRLIKDASKMKDVQKELGVTVDGSSMSFSNIIDAISVVQTKMGITGTTAEEAATTIEGSINSMKAAWTNFLTGMADPDQNFDALVDNLVNSIITVGKNVIPRIQMMLPRLAAGLGKVFSEMLTGIMNNLDMFGPLAPLVEQIVRLIQSVRDKFAEVTGDAEKMDRIRGIVSGVASAFGSIVSAIGWVIGAVVSFVTSAGVLTVVSGIVNGISAVFGFLAAHIREVAAVVGVVLTVFFAYWAIIKVITIATTIYNTVLAIFKAYQMLASGATLAATAAQWGMNAAMLACPITWIILAIVALIAIIVILALNWDKVKEKALQVWEAIKTVWGIVSQWFLANVIEPLKNFFQTLWEAIKMLATEAWNGIKTVASTVANAVKAVWNAVKSFFLAFCNGVKNFFMTLWAAVKQLASESANLVKSIWNAVKSWFQSFCNAVKNFFQNLWNAIKRGPEVVKNAIVSAFTAAKNAVVRVWQGVVDFFSGIWNSISGFVGKITGAAGSATSGAATVKNAASAHGSRGGRAFASGGYVDSPIMGLVGEAGPEMIIPLSAQRRRRGMSLWQQAGRILGAPTVTPQISLPSYTPGSSVTTNNASTSNTNNYSPQFNLTLSGTVDRTTERTIKRWVQEALEETFDSMSRTSPRLTEV